MNNVDFNSFQVVKQLSVYTRTNLLSPEFLHKQFKIYNFIPMGNIVIKLHSEPKPTYVHNGTYARLFYFDNLKLTRIKSKRVIYLSNVLHQSNLLLLYLPNCILEEYQFGTIPEVDIKISLETF